MDGTIYPSQHFPLGVTFVCQAGNFWTLLRTSIFSSYKHLTKAEIRIQQYNGKKRRIDVAPIFAFTIIIILIITITTTSIFIVTLGLFRLHKLTHQRTAFTTGSNT